MAGDGTWSKLIVYFQGIVFFISTGSEGPPLLPQTSVTQMHGHPCSS